MSVSESHRLAEAAPARLRPRFRDPAQREQFERDGYVVIPGAARSAVRPMRRVYRRLIGDVPAAFQSTVYLADPQLKSEVDDQIFERMMPIIDEILVDHRRLLSNFVTKGRDPNATMSPHQDWTFVDERAGASFNIWVPLVDVDHNSGALSLLRGGHRVPFTIRGTDTVNPFFHVEQDAADYMVEIPMRAGDVLVHDHRVLHTSPPNRRRRPRLALACAVIGADSDPIHFRQVAEGRLEQYSVGRDFFTEHRFGAPGLPACAVPIGVVEFEQPMLTAAYLDEFSAVVDH